MRKFYSFVFLFWHILAFAQKAETVTLPNQPKLIVGIIVDQMRYDYLYRYAANKFSN